MDCKIPNPPKIHLVSSADSPEFTFLTRALTRSAVIGLDAEWKPLRSQQSAFPTVSLLQIACQTRTRLGDNSDESLVFLIDLASIPLSSIWELLKDVFVSPDILKLGFRFKQDLIFLSSTFCAQGCDPGFDRVEPYLDITNIYNVLLHKPGRKTSKETKSLATICEEVLCISLSKELQCSDWSHRPLTEEQKIYAAMDAHCLLGIFEVFQAKVLKEGLLPCYGTLSTGILYFLLQAEVPVYSPTGSTHKVVIGPHSSNVTLGLKEILHTPDVGNKLTGTTFCKALDIIQATASSEYYQRIAKGVEIFSRMQSKDTTPMEESLLKIVRKYGDKILLQVSDRKLRTPKKKSKRRSAIVAVSCEKQLQNFGDWQGPPPWDLSLGGDGCPKFLCDVMVEGLAKHLRCVGVDAAIPSSKKPEPRELIDQAYKENRVLLTRDAKLLRYQYLIQNQIYKVKSLLKNEQLLEVIQSFQLKISEDQLMSRCTKCNGRFIQKPLTTEEAIQAAKGFQRIPSCLFDKNLEFWQCMDCNQLYWEGTQYHNAVQKFTDVCKLND